MTVADQVKAIRKAWLELMPENPPITYGSGPAVDLDLFATVAINVLTDWDKRSDPAYRQCFDD